MPFLYFLFVCNDIYVPMHLSKNIMDEHFRLKSFSWQTTVTKRITLPCFLPKLFTINLQPHFISLFQCTNSFQSPCSTRKINSRRQSIWLIAFVSQSSITYQNILGRHVASDCRWSSEILQTSIFLWTNKCWEYLLLDFSTCLQRSRKAHASWTQSPSSWSWKIICTNSIRIKYFGPLRSCIVDTSHFTLRKRGRC